MRNSRTFDFVTGYTVPSWHNLEHIDAALYHAFNGDAGGSFVLSEALVLGDNGFTCTAPSAWSSVQAWRASFAFTMNPGTAQVFDVEAGGLWRWTGQSPTPFNPKLTVLSGNEFRVDSGGGVNFNGASLTFDGPTATGSGSTTFGGVCTVHAHEDATVDGNGDFVMHRLDVARDVDVAIHSDVDVSIATATFIRQDATFGGVGDVNFTSVIREGRLRLRGSSGAQVTRRLTTITTSPAAASTDYDVYRISTASGISLEITIADGTREGQLLRFVDLGLGGSNITTYLAADGTSILGITVAEHWIEFLWTDAAGWIPVGSAFR